MEHVLFSKRLDIKIEENEELLPPLIDKPFSSFSSSGRPSRG
jgi:hypothetical protein